MGQLPEQLVPYYWRRLRDPSDAQAAASVATALIFTELVMCLGIVWKVPYTEIDWQAYMEQISQVAEGERNYFLIRGGTGPLVYPAGFVWLFGALRHVTGGGDVPTAQLWFAAMYLTSQGIVFALYIWSQVVPPWALVLLCTSKRIHSIWLLRLFNDGPATAIAALGALALLCHRPRLAVVIFSAAVSVKMHVLLLAPPVAVVLLQEQPLAVVAEAVALGFILQLALAGPFLVAAPGQYFSRAFELSRVFLPEWSVNLRFLPPDVFQSRWVAAALLLAHVGLLLGFASYRWTEQPGGLTALVQSCCTKQYHSTTDPSADPDTAPESKHVLEGHWHDSLPALIQPLTSTLTADSDAGDIGRAETEPVAARHVGSHETGPRPRHILRQKTKAPCDELSSAVSRPGLTSRPSFRSTRVAAMDSPAEHHADGGAPSPTVSHSMPGEPSSWRHPGVDPLITGSATDHLRQAAEAQTHVAYSRDQSGRSAVQAGRVLATLFTGNVIGVICARSLHYQFYAWYAYTLPLLLWWCSFPDAVRVALWAAIEVLWNIFPSTTMTSLLLLVCHVVLVAALWASPQWSCSQHKAPVYRTRHV